MHERTLLGPADISDERLAALVAASYDVPAARLHSSRATVVPYDQSTITTAGRYWVDGLAEVDGHQVAYRFFVKEMQSWDRSPEFAVARALMPPELVEWAIASVPWRTEALAYRSDLRDRLPDGLRMPRAYAVDDLDACSASVWLEPVEVPDDVLHLDRYREAAHLLGRLAASPAVAELGEVGGVPFRVRDYADGRLRHQVIPMLRDEDVWRHPLVSGAFDDSLRERLLDAAQRAGTYADEADAAPTLVAHGDACPNNLLVQPGRSGFTLIDYALWHRMPVGFDLAQLLVGDVQIGRRTADDLGEIEDAVVPAYVEGLRAEGCDVPALVVQRTHRLILLLFSGLSSLPVEHFSDEPTPALHHLVAQRAAIARLSLDLLDRTA